MAYALKIIFPDRKAAERFGAWMSDGGGEQDFMNAEEDAGITRFQYHPEDEQFPINDKRRYGRFLENGTIIAHAGEKEEA